MSDPKVLQLSLLTFTADKLEIKVKNISGGSLEKTLAIEIYPPMYLVSSQINAAAKAAATNQKPLGVARLDKVVSGPAGWSVWAKRETSDSSVIILLLNDLDQDGNDVAPPVKLAANAEFIISIPLNSQAQRATINLLYSYQEGTEPEPGPRIDGQLELKADTIISPPDVKLTTNKTSPTAIPPGELARVIWHIKDGVSATLRGPLPGGNTELTLSPDPHADFKISDGFVEVRVVSGMTYVLQAEVKGTDGQPNVLVTKMLSLDTKNNKHLYVQPRPSRVLPYGLIEIDWAAWGVDQVELRVSGHTTRTIRLTQQTLGHFSEGSGVMRVSATKFTNEIKTISEAVSIDAEGEDTRTKNVQVISWVRLDKPGIGEHLLSLAVIAPKIALLTFQGLYIAEVGNFDPTPQKLNFKLAMPPEFESARLTAVEQRFVWLRRNFSKSPDFELAPHTPDGTPDAIPPVTLPPEVRNFALSPKAVYDLVGVGKRAYAVVEAPPVKGGDLVRHAYSVGFDSSTKKADLRREPLLEPLIGYRLVAFDNALYALNRDTGQMLRFDITNEGTLDKPKRAASAVKKGEGGAQDQSMIKNGLIVPVGRVLVVFNPTSVPSIDSLEPYGLRNTLSYESTSSISGSVPQDLIYNPQKDYWARCGHDLDIKSGALAAFRSGDSKRLWVIQPDGEMYTLAVGSETLFAHDYVLKVPSKPLPPA